MTNFFYQCSKNKLAFTEEGGFAVLLSLLHSPCSDQVAQSLSQVFHNLCNIKMEHRVNWMSNEGLIKYLVDFADRNKESSIIQEHLLWALLNITLIPGMQKVN